MTRLCPPCCSGVQAMVTCSGMQVLSFFSSKSHGALNCVQTHWHGRCNFSLSHLPYIVQLCVQYSLFHSTTQHMPFHDRKFPITASPIPTPCDKPAPPCSPGQYRLKTGAGFCQLCPPVRFMRWRRACHLHTLTLKCMHACAHEFYYYSTQGNYSTTTNSYECNLA